MCVLQLRVNTRNRRADCYFVLVLSSAPIHDSCALELPEIIFVGPERISLYVLPMSESATELPVVLLLSPVPFVVLVVLPFPLEAGLSSSSSEQATNVKSANVAVKSNKNLFIKNAPIKKLLKNIFNNFFKLRQNLLSNCCFNLKKCNTAEAVHLIVLNTYIFFVQCKKQHRINIWGK